MLHPIVAVKDVPADGSAHAYQRVHVSFQSTGSTNLSTVNALDRVHLYLESEPGPHKKSRGRGDDKRTWTIEDNEARHLYCDNYGVIDTIDDYIRKANMQYIVWKYWHSPMNHYKAWNCVMSWDIYRRIAHGEFGEEFKVAVPMDFHSFRLELSARMLRYDPRHRTYPGDELARSCTKQTARERAGTNAQPTLASALFSAPKCRMLGDLSTLELHQVSLARANNDAACVICGKPTRYRCTKCKGACPDARLGGLPVHHPGARGDSRNNLCFLRAHSTTFYGLGHRDSPAIGAPKRKTKRVAGQKRIKKHKAAVLAILAD